MHVADIDGRIYERRKRERMLELKFAAWCLAWFGAVVLALFWGEFSMLDFAAYVILALIVFCGLVGTYGIICVLAQCVRYAIQIWKFHKNREA